MSPRRGGLIVRVIAITLAVTVGLLFIAVLGVRYGGLTSQGRLLLEARADGLAIGRLGRLSIQGLSGDIWRDVRIRRLTVRDEKGVWLEAANIHLTWTAGELLKRSFRADNLEIETLRILRRPILGPKRVDRDLPVSFHIGKASARIETLPAFSYTRGLFDVGLTLNVARQGRQSGALRANSRLHAGDHLSLVFNLGRTGPLQLVADAQEARGGALAGSLGLPAGEPFRVDIRADGALSKGAFHALATSGRLALLRAEGDWSPASGRGGALVDLTASALTAPLARRLGPRLVIGLAGQRTGPGLYALDGLARSEGLTLHAAGTGNLGERRLGPEGLWLEAKGGGLTRLTGGPKMGAFGLSGRLLGDLSAWRFKGSGAVENAAVSGYGLARVAGPIELVRTKRSLSLSASLAGSGGHGEGYPAALLGGAPVARLAVERQANGQVLIRQLDLTGRGLSVQATGSRGLLGALALRGRAKVSNLAAARPGASGAMDIGWSAGQPSAGQAWDFTLDARGARLALGFGELDRLLGGAPRLQARGRWISGRLELASANLDGAALKASLAGYMSPERTLTFKTAWSASGPFQAGPIALSGQIRGSGGITGSVATPRLDLLADIDQVDIPRLPLKDVHAVLSFVRQPSGAVGTLAMTGASAYGPARARAAFTLPPGGVDLSEVDVDAGGLRARGAISLRNRTASAANLDLAVGPGAFLAAGRLSGDLRVTGDGGTGQARLNLAADQARWAGSGLTVRKARLTAEGPLSRLPYALAAEGGSGGGGWTLAGQGALAELGDAHLLTFDGSGRIGKRDLRTSETASLRFGPDGRVGRLRLVGPDGGRLDLDGDLRGEAADVQARVAGMNLNLFNADLDGKVDATLTLKGRGAALQGVLDARLDAARARGAPPVQGLDGTLKARLAGADLTVEVVATNPQGLKASADIVLPAEASAAPFRVAVARQRPMRGRFAAEGEVRPLFDLLIGGGRALSGQVRTQGTLAGTLADPKVSGTFAVERGRFDDGPSGLSLREVVLRADLERDTINVTEARGVDARNGKISGQGRVSLLRDGASTFKLDLQGFRLIDNETATANASGQATITRAVDGKVKLSGDLTLDRADVAADPPIPSGVVAMDVIEVSRPDNLPAALTPRRRRGDGWALDVKLHAPRRVFLKGRGLDVEFSLEAHVGGTTTRADLTGVARVVRGDYDFAGKRFEIDDRSLVYLSTRPESIRLQLDARREDPSLTVGVRIRGTAARPEITLASTPSLPNDEVLAQVLFGRSASQLSPVEAAQLASALSSMTGGGGLDVIGNLRSFAGLDRLAFAGGNAAGVTVSGGKYLTDDVYLELTGGGREGPSAQVEWRIRRNLSILSRIAGQAGNRLAVRWRKDY